MPQGGAAFAMVPADALHGTPDCSMSGGSGAAVGKEVGGMENIGAVIITKPGVCDSCIKKLVGECLKLREQGTELCKWVAKGKSSKCSSRGAKGSKSA